MIPVAAKNTLSPETRSSSSRTSPACLPSCSSTRALVLADPDTRLHAATDALDAAGGEHRLGGAPDAHQHVDAGAVLHRGHEPRRDVAVHDQLHPRAGRTDLLEEGLVAFAVEDHHGQVLDAAILRPGDPFEVLRHRCGDVDHPGRGRSDDQLLHVVEVGVEHRAPLGERHGRDATGNAARDQPGAVDRIDRDVDRRGIAVADLLTDVEHRRLVLLALADDHDAVHVDEPEAPAHRIDGGLVGLLLLVAPHVPGRGHRGALGDADQLEGKVAVDRRPQVARPRSH